jgi:hypothetical protein
MRQLHGRSVPGFESEAAGEVRFREGKLLTGVFALDGMFRVKVTLSAIGRAGGLVPVLGTAPDAGVVGDGGVTPDPGFEPEGLPILLAPCVAG